jgi:hypothetical protein
MAGGRVLVSILLDSLVPSLVRFSSRKPRIGDMRHVLLIFVFLLMLPTAWAAQNGGRWLAEERSHLSQERAEHRYRKEKKKFDFRVCREKATGERIAANLRAEFVHACVRERRKSETAFGAKAEMAR